MGGGWTRICVGKCRSFGLDRKGLCRWAGVSGEDDFVCRMERMWRLGGSGFWHTQEYGSTASTVMSAVRSKADVPATWPGSPLFSQTRTCRRQSIQTLLAVTMCAFIGMTIWPEGRTNSARALSDSTARASMASPPRLSAKGEALTSMRTNSFAEGNRMEPSWRATCMESNFGSRDTGVGKQFG